MLFAVKYVLFHLMLPKTLIGGSSVGASAGSLTSEHYISVPAHITALTSISSHIKYFIKELVMY